MNLSQVQFNIVQFFGIVIFRLIKMCEGPIFLCMLLGTGNDLQENLQIKFRNLQIKLFSFQKRKFVIKAKFEFIHNTLRSLSMTKNRSNNNQIIL